MKKIYFGNVTAREKKVRKQFSNGYFHNIEFYSTIKEI